MFIKENNIIHSYNPANKELLGSIPVTTDDEIENIVKKCKDAFKIWSKLSYEERGNCLKKLATILENNSNDLAILMTKEMGRPLTESLPEVSKSIKFIRSFADKAEKML